MGQARTQTQTEFEVGQIICSTIQRYSHHRYVVTRKSRACGRPVMFGKLLSPAGRELEPEVLLGRRPYEPAHEVSGIV